jgi:hypothetical protein
VTFHAAQSEPLDRKHAQRRLTVSGPLAWSLARLVAAATRSQGNAGLFRACNKTPTPVGPKRGPLSNGIKHSGT